VHGVARYSATKTLLREFMFDRKRPGQAPWLLFVVFYAILANIPFWAASYWLGLLPLGWFCLEYAAVGLLAFFLRRSIAVLLLLLVITADLTSAVSKTYYLSPTECLSNLTSLHQFPGTRLITVAAVTALILLVAAIAASFPMRMHSGQRWRAAVSLIVLMAVALSVDCASVLRETGNLPNPFRMARPSDSNKYSKISNLWAARYPVIRLVRDQELFGHSRSSASQPDLSPVPSATALAIGSANLVAKKRSQEMPNIVLILVESWGFEQDSSVRNALVRPYAQPDLLARYRFLQGTVPFHGSTIPGEARELCGSKMGYHLLDASRQELQGCLPDQLAALGYHDIALHGMDGHMFNRSSWYRNIGFQEQWFRDQFRQQGLPDCMGAFLGTCDAAIAEWIGQRLERKAADPEFVHWMTLNSHLPVPIPSALPAGASCTSFSPPTEQPALCSWYQLVFNVHDSVARLAMSKLARPTVFVIVGDHAPPFSNPEVRSQFSSTDVPYVLLLPHSNNGTPSTIGD
jgi:phosphoglycerol transferase MdoB-like AlkP superfamily enzyme